MLLPVMIKSTIITIINVCKCSSGLCRCKYLVSGTDCLQDVSYLALELVKPVFDRAGLSAAHSGEWFIVRPCLHGDT